MSLLLLQVRHQSACDESFDDLTAGARAVWRALCAGGHPVVGGGGRRGGGRMQPLLTAVHHADSTGPAPRRHRPAALPHAAAAAPAGRALCCHLARSRLCCCYPRRHRRGAPLVPARARCAGSRAGVLHRVLNTRSNYTHRHRVLHVCENIPRGALVWPSCASTWCQRAATTRTSHDPARSG